MGPAWTFQRSGDRLTIERRETDAGHELVISGPGQPRTHGFRDLASLVEFQQDMEHFLLKTGWSFERFSPDRRAGGDRRTFPRVENDRRRWWTDSFKLLPLPKWRPEALRRRKGTGSTE